MGAAGREHTRMEELVRAELKKYFRPEFLNRIDDIIIFHSLDEKEIAAIVEVQLHRLKDRLAQQQLTVTLDPAATRFLAKEGYDPQFGARPLKRAIQEHLLNPLAMKLLAGEFKAGDTIKVTAAAGNLKFQPQK
jgi:ATP-dependent Clp protease ATP-binding subunit ClpA